MPKLTTRASMDARIADRALIIDELKEEKMTPNLTILQKSSTFGAKIKKWQSFYFIKTYVRDLFFGQAVVNSFNGKFTNEEIQKFNI